jgi:hypothetical protein
MDMEDFQLALRELEIIGVDVNIETEPAELPGFLYVKNVKVEGDHKLLIRIKDDEILEVVKLHRKSPRRMTPEAFVKEVGLNAMEGNGASIG